MFIHTHVAKITSLIVIFTNCSLDYKYLSLKDEKKKSTVLLRPDLQITISQKSQQVKSLRGNKSKQTDTDISHQRGSIRYRQQTWRLQSAQHDKIINNNYPRMTGHKLAARKYSQPCASFMQLDGTKLRMTHQESDRSSQ